MSDVAIFSIVFGGLFVLRLIAATVVFLLILPRGDRCPMCDTATVRLHSRLLNRIQLTKRWCMTCGWDGVMRMSPGDDTAATSAQQNRKRAPVAQPSRKR